MPNPALVVEAMRYNRRERRGKKINMYETPDDYEVVVL